MLTFKEMLRVVRHENNYKNWSSPMNKGQTVYTGKALDGETKITAETGGYAPLVTVSFEPSGFQFQTYLSPHGAAELGLMLIAASRAAGGSALLATEEACQ